jgi:hypothetical protein
VGEYIRQGSYSETFILHSRLHLGFYHCRLKCRGFEFFFHADTNSTNQNISVGLGRAARTRLLRLIKARKWGAAHPPRRLTSRKKFQHIRESSSSLPCGEPVLYCTTVLDHRSRIIRSLAKLYIL